MEPTLPTAGLIAWALRRVMPPILTFGGPTQRSRQDGESYWHIPITIRPRLGIGPASLPGSELYLDVYDADGRKLRSSRMGWGDMLSEAPRDFEAIRVGHVSLAPVAYRSEGDGQGAWLADQRFVNQDARVWQLSDRHRFKLRLKCGKFQRESPHFYLVRCPAATATNGLFSVEIEYEQAGDGYVVAPATPAAIEKVSGSSRRLSKEQQWGLSSSLISRRFNAGHMVWLRFAQGDLRAKSYASDLGAAFRMAGWEGYHGTTLDERQELTGLKICVKEMDDKPQVAMAIADAFQATGIDFDWWEWATLEDGRVIVFVYSEKED